MTQLKLVNDAEQALESFEEAWKHYPHHPGRSKKPMSRSHFMAIISPEGFQTRSKDKDSGLYVAMHHRATPEEIVEGVKRYWKSLPAKEGSYSRDTNYVEGMQVWLNGGRWEE